MLIKYGTIMNGFGGSAVQSIVDSDKNSDKATLQDLLDKLIPMLDSDGIPIKVESMNNMRDLLLNISNR